jgi:signal transduction histidine kinase
MIACAPMVGLTLHTAWDDRDKAITSARHRALAIEDASASEEESTYNKTRTLLVTMSQLDAIRAGDAKQSKSLVDELSRSYARYSDLGVADTNGNVIASVTASRAKVDLPDKEFFHEAMKSDHLYVSQTAALNASRKPMIYAGFPVFDTSGHVTGVVYATITVSWFSRVSGEIVSRLPRESAWSEIAPDDTILVRFPSGKNWIGQKFGDKTLLQTIRTRGEGVVERKDSAGTPTFFIYSPKQTHVLPRETIALLAVPREVLFAEADRALYQSLGWLSVAAGIPLMLVWIGSDLLIIRPVRELVRSTARLAEGDLTVRTGLRPGRDELGRLTNAFDSMAQALENREIERARAAHKLQILSHKLVDAQETERRHIARELHDEIGQSLTVAEMNLQAALETSRHDVVNRKLQASMEAVERVHEQVHDLSLNLRPSMLDDLGLEAALRWYTNRQGALTGLVTRFKSDPIDQRLDPVVETECFRVAQEALTNVVKHSKATAVGVELRKNGEMLHLHVRDDGVGFDVSQLRDKAVQGASLGLLSMEERANLAGGGLEFISAPGSGTEVHAWFPLKYKEAAA